MKQRCNHVHKPVMLIHLHTSTHPAEKWHSLKAEGVAPDGTHKGFYGYSDGTISMGMPVVQGGMPPQSLNLYIIVHWVYSVK